MRSPEQTPGPDLTPGLRPALAASIRPSLTKKVGFLLLLMWLGAVAALVVLYRHLSATSSDTHFINVAGRQRMLAQRLYLFAGMSQIGREEDRRSLQSVAQGFEEAQNALESGGPVRGAVLPPATGAVREALARVRRIWSAIKPRLRTKVGSPTGDPAPLEAFLERQLPRLTEAADAVVRTYQEQSQRRRDRTLIAFVATAAFDLLLLLAGLWLTRTFISRPVRLLEEATRRLRSGDFSQRIPVFTRDELAGVTSRFNELTDHLDRMICEKEKRLEAAESHLQRILHHAPVGIFRVDGAGVLTLAEGRAAHGHGLRLGAERGRSVFDAYAHLPWFPEQIRRALAGEAFVGGGVVGSVHLEVRYEPERGEDGRIAGVVGVCAERAAAAAAAPPGPEAAPPGP